MEVALGSGQQSDERKGGLDNTQVDRGAHLSTPKKNTNDHERADVPGSRSRAEHGPNLKPPHRLDTDSSQQSDISNSVLREWVNLMNDQGSQPETDLKTQPPFHGPLRFRTPPASWAKWPSHTRHERAGPAGKEDDVIPRDFAVRVGSNGSSTTWSTDRPSESSKRYITPASRSLSSQLGKAVKGGLNKVVQGTLNRDIRASLETYRGRRNSDGHLEYPELEILPMKGGYKELQALEQQIDTMKRGSVTAESQLARLETDNMRTPLSARLAEEVHMMQHKASGISCQDDEDTAATLSAISPSTPRQLLLAPRGASEENGHLETPASQVSYEDCVPKHMLEDERPVDDYATSTDANHHTQAT